jgi:hypothetical protein
MQKASRENGVKSVECGMQSVARKESRIRDVESRKRRKTAESQRAVGDHKRGNSKRLESKRTTNWLANVDRGVMGNFLPLR